MELNLRGKRVLVTGASKGIGLAVARAFAQEGCRVDIASRSRASLDEAAAGIRQDVPGADIRVHAADLSLGADQERLAHDCGDADILINNAGSAGPGHLEDTSEAQWQESWALKVFGYINMSRAFYRAMQQRRAGVIVNIIGYAGERLNARYIIGTTGNAALMAFTRSVGSQSPDFGVRVVGINPGYTATERAETQLRAFSEKKYGSADRWREVERDLKLPFGRMARADEIADATLFLASPRASYISGTILTIDGGATNRNG